MWDLLGIPNGGKPIKMNFGRYQITNPLFCSLTTRNDTTILYWFDKMCAPGKVSKTPETCFKTFSNTLILIFIEKVVIIIIIKKKIVLGVEANILVTQVFGFEICSASVFEKLPLDILKNRYLRYLKKHMIIKTQDFRE